MKSAAPPAPAAIALLAALLFSFAIPIGEGPDEPAHLRHAESLRSAPDLAANPYTYEQHQPRLYYRIAATAADLLDLDLDYPFVINPGYPHTKKGGAFLPPPPSDQEKAAARGVRAIRWLGLLFLAATVAALSRVAAQETEGVPELATAGCLTFILAPQLASLAGTVSNDSLLFALCAWALYGQRKIHGGEAGLLLCAATGLATALAPWAKASGFVLATTLLLAAIQLIRHRSWKSAAVLLLPVALSWSAWYFTEAAGLRDFQGQASQLSLGLVEHPGLLADYPFWLIQLWLSYWSKPGWLQLRLPLPLYLIYLPATLLVAKGLHLAWKEKRKLATSPAIFWAAALLTNAAAYAAFILFVDFQHQGRLFYPTLAAAVGLAACALKNLDAGQPRLRHQLRKYLPPATALLILGQLATLGVVLADEGWP